MSAFPYEPNLVAESFPAGILKWRRKGNLKLACPAFNRANLEFVNLKKTKKEVCCLCNDVIGLLDTSYLYITCNF